MTDPTDRDPVLNLLRCHPGPAARLRDLAFDLGRAHHGEDVRLASGAPPEAIAGDGSGGTFFVYGGGAVLHPSSEGGAGLIGDSVTDALEVIVGLPSWHDRVHLAPSADAARPKSLRGALEPLGDARRAARAHRGYASLVGAGRPGAGAVSP
jgi:hypothetical protein